MYLRNEQLTKCERLKEHGFPQEVKTGSHVGRGFADLGFEQFLMLPSGKLLSLFTGDCSELPAGHAEYFFVIPTVDRLIEYMESCGAYVDTIDLDDDSEWSVHILGANGLLIVSSATLWDALIEACLQFQELEDTATERV